MTVGWFASPMPQPGANLVPARWSDTDRQAGLGRLAASDAVSRRSKQGIGELAEWHRRAGIRLAGATAERGLRRRGGGRQSGHGAAVAMVARAAARRRRRLTIALGAVVVARVRAGHAGVVVVVARIAMMLGICDRHTLGRGASMRMMRSSLTLSSTWQPTPQ